MDAKFFLITAAFKNSVVSGSSLYDCETSKDYILKYTICCLKKGEEIN